MDQEVVNSLGNLKLTKEEEEDMLLLIVTVLEFLKNAL